MPLLPALSSVLQVVRASHSSASIADAITVSRTYDDWLFKMIDCVFVTSFGLFACLFSNCFNYSAIKCCCWSRCSLKSILLVSVLLTQTFLLSLQMHQRDKKVFLYAAINLEEIRVKHGMCKHISTSTQQSRPEKSRACCRFLFVKAQRTKLICLFKCYAHKWIS